MDRVTVAASVTALLACVNVSLKHGIPPLLVFCRPSLDFVLVAFVPMTSPSRLDRTLCLFFCDRVFDLRASIRADCPDPASLAILGHVMPADRARRFNTQAIRAHLILSVHVVPALLANVTSLADPARVRFHVGRACNARGVFGGDTENGQGVHGVSAQRTGSHALGVTRGTDSIHPTVGTADSATVLSHDANMPQPPGLIKGTAIVACEQTGRIARGMEIDPGYTAVILERFATLTSLTPTLVR